MASASGTTFLQALRGVVDFARAVTAQPGETERAAVAGRQVAHLQMIVRRGGCSTDDATRT
eukprot:3723013-Pyramimonas_sp.AAC.1